VTIPDLDEDRLRDSLLRPGGLWQRLQVVAETGSTNADLAAAARTGEPGGSVLVADSQSAGRGRMGRSWSSPAGSSISMSVLLRPGGVASSRWTWLPLLAGVAVADALESAAGVAASLKWPNDVLIEDRKICGILAERVETPDGPACVLGLGLNVSLTEDELPMPTATSLALLKPTAVPDRTTVVARILQALEPQYRRWEAGDSQQLTASYLDLCGTVGRLVRVQLGHGRTLEGSATGVDADGRLVVATRDGTESVGAGDVLHLR
jgi:BirA family biotin operon repressor/biotin-[acetyl-CoA-carboxylase] ligase